MKAVVWKKNRREQFSAWMFLLPAIIVYLVFKYYPMFLGFFISLFNINIVKLPGEFCGLDNYIRAFKDLEFYQALWHNIQFWLIGLAINFWPPILLALLVNEVRKAKTFFRMMYFIPAVAPAVAMTVLWKYIWQPDYGFANYFLSLFHLPPQLWLNNPSLTMWCMYFPGLIMSGGMSLLIYMAALQDIPEEHYEAAMVEGAGFFQKIRYITLPQIKSIVLIMFILDLIGRFNEVQSPLIYTGGGPIGTTETMILYAYKSALNNLDYSYAITLANIVFFIVFIITALQLRVTSNKD